MSFTVETKENKTFTLQQGNEVKNWTFEEYSGNDTYLVLKDGDQSVGYVTVVAMPGQGFFNRECTCDDLELNSVRSRVKYTLGFTKMVTIGNKQFKGITWEVYAKIT